jgi:hypothetical protein
MNNSIKYRWVPAVLTAGTIYLLAGIGLPNPSSPGDAQFLWRLAAWLLSGVVFLGHFAYEHVHLKNVPRTVAFHVSLAVALGALALSGAANIHGLRTETAHQHLLRLSLIIWPVITAVPAFLVAFAGSLILARIRAKGKSRIGR